MNILATHIKQHLRAHSLGIGLFGIALLCSISGCGRHSASATPPASPPAVPEVETARPLRRLVVRTIQQPARIEAFEETPIFAKIAGYAAKVNVEIGTRVRKGELLAALSVPELVEEARERELQVTQSRVAIEQAEKGLQVTQAAVGSAHCLAAESAASRKRAASMNERWKSESVRVTRLVQEKVLDVQSGEETANQFRSAAATLDEADAKLRSTQAAIREAEARTEKAAADVRGARSALAVTEAALRRTQAMLNYAQILAPFDGVVSQRNVHTGHFLQSSTGNGPRGEALFVVVRTDRVRVFLEVPESDAVLVTAGVKAVIRIPVLNDREFVGRVAGSSWSLEPNQRTLRTEIDFDNPDGNLRPGMYAHAFLEVPQTGVLTIPSSGVVTRDGVSACYVIEEDKAVRTPIRIGGRLGADVEILKKQVPATAPGQKPRWIDFTGAESVIVGKLGDVTDGEPVRVKKAPEERVSSDDAHPRESGS